MATIERIPPNLEEAAQNLGANWYQMFRCTILPLSLPGLISGSLLVYSISISGYDGCDRTTSSAFSAHERRGAAAVAHDLPGMLALDIAG
jgi:ABC-type sulfate transport system permease subunit